MTIKEIYEAFDDIGCITFATIDGKYPATRIAHFFAYDDDGLYFRTMNTKSFFSQLMKHKTVSACGIYGDGEIEYAEDDMPIFERSYTIRVTGDVKTVSPDSLRKKAKKDSLFELGLKDMERYRTMRTFVLYRGYGEIFDFDFEKEHRENKLLRSYFSFNGLDQPFRGLTINQEKCTQCGACADVCTFDAIEKNSKGYKILNHKCDACGDCTIACAEKAIDVTVE